MPDCWLFHFAGIMLRIKNEGRGKDAIFRYCLLKLIFRKPVTRSITRAAKWSPRFDFRNVEASFELNDASKTIKVLSESDFQVNQLLDILRAKLLKRGIEGSSLDVPENIVHSGKTWFVEAKLKQGIEARLRRKSSK